MSFKYLVDLFHIRNGREKMVIDHYLIDAHVTVRYSVLFRISVHSICLSIGALSPTSDLTISHS